MPAQFFTVAVNASLDFMTGGAPTRSSIHRARAAPRGSAAAAHGRVAPSSSATTSPAPVREGFSST